jgi:hypothetical protein
MKPEILETFEGRVDKIEGGTAFKGLKSKKNGELIGIFLLKKRNKVDIRQSMLIGIP